MLSAAAAHLKIIVEREGSNCFVQINIMQDLIWYLQSSHTVCNLLEPFGTVGPIFGDFSSV